MDDGPLALGELEGRAHRLERKQDVGEEDRRVDAEPEGLQRDRQRKLGRLADLEERVLFAERAVLGHVAARLPHEPHRRDVGRLAPASAEEAVVHGGWRV